MQLQYSNIGTEPVSLSEIKTWLKIDYADEDALIESLITGVREQIENFTGLSLVAKTIEYFSVEIPEEITLPYPPHKAIEEVKINGEVTTNFLVTGLNEKVITPSTVYAPSVNNRGIYVKYTTKDKCPDAIKNAIKKELNEQYRNRGNTFEGSIVELSENTFVNLMQFVKA